MAQDPLDSIFDETLGDIKDTPVTAQTNLTFEPVEAQEATAVENLDAGELALKASAEMDKVGESLAQLRGINQDRLAGKIPSDVLSELRKNAAEKAQAMGMGDSSFAGRNLEARDLGLTSMQLQAAGESQELNLNKMQAGLAEFQQKRSEFSSTFLESSRQFNEKLAVEQDRTRLSAMNLKAKRDEFNASQNLKLIGYISDLAASQATVSANLAINDVSDKNIVKGYKNIMTRIDRML
jgi:hypothetical protein